MATIRIKVEAVVVKPFRVWRLDGGDYLAVPELGGRTLTVWQPPMHQGGSVADEVKRLRLVADALEAILIAANALAERGAK